MVAITHPAQRRQGPPAPTGHGQVGDVTPGMHRPAIDPKPGWRRADVPTSNAGNDGVCPTCRCCNGPSAPDPK